MKEFFGYEWSAAKGNEGIKYLGGVQLDKLEGEDEDEGNLALEEEDKRVLSNIFNLDNINTPLYDPHNKNNVDKINHLINQNFKRENIEIPENLKEYVIDVPLVDMLDFNRVDFNKSISLTPKKKIYIESNSDSIKLGKIAPYVTDKINLSDINVSDYITTDNLLQNRQGVEKYIGTPQVERITQYKKNDILISNIRPYLKKIWFSDKSGGCSNDVIVFRSSNSKKTLPKYLFYLMSMDVFFDFIMSGKQGVKMPRGDKDQIRLFPTPFPDINIQQQIVDACSEIDQEAEKAKKIATNSKEEMETLFQEAFSKADKTFRISDTDVFELSIGKRVLKNEINQEGIGIPVYSANIFEPFGHINKELIKDFNGPSVLWGIDGDWMVNCLPKNIPFYPTDHCGVLRIKGDTIHPKYVAWVLEKEGERVRFSRTNRASMDSMRGINVKAPAKDIQTKLIKEVEKREKKINASQEIINGIAKRREEVIKFYLMDKSPKPILAMAAEPKVDYEKKL